jgi:hypothetical protein
MVHRAKLLLTCLVGGPILISTAIAQQRPSLVVGPLTAAAIYGPEGGPFSPSTFEYRVSASEGVVSFSVTTPAWLTASPSTGAADPGGVTVKLAVSPAASQLGPGVYGPSIAFTNVTNGLGSTHRMATLTIGAPPAVAPPATPGAPPATAGAPPAKARAPTAKAVAPPAKAVAPPAKMDSLWDKNTGYLLDQSGEKLLDDRGERMLPK